MKIWFLSVELIVIIISLIVTIRKIKCSRNCGKCKKDVCVKKAELVINPLWVVLYVLGVVSFELSAMLLRGMAAWLGLIIGLVGFLGALFFIPFAYRFNHIGIYFLRCLNKDTYVEYDNIEHISLEKTGRNDGDWDNASILTQEYVITTIKNNQKQFFKKESVFETQKTTEMLKKYCPKKFPKQKAKNKKHSKEKS